MASPYEAGYVDTMPNPGDFSLPLFRQKYLIEYIRTNKYARYMGKDNQMPIQIVAEPKKGGETVKIPMIGRLKERGVVGNMPLAGREADLALQSHTLTLELRRQAVARTERDEQFVFAKVLPEIRPHLLRWSKEQLRDDVTDAFFSVQPRVTMRAPLVNPDPTQVRPGDPAVVPLKRQATDAELDAWLVGNEDRAFFGTEGGTVAGDWGASMANVINNANAVPNAEMIRCIKSQAMMADPHITPIKVGSDEEEYFVLFCDHKMFKRLRADPEIQQYHQHALPREGRGFERNPIRTGGDIEYDGVIIREITEIGVHTDASGTTAANNIGSAVLAGVEAVGVAIGMDPDFRQSKEDDYGHIKGVGITECLGVEKLQRFDANTPGQYVDHGSLTVFANCA